MGDELNLHSLQPAQPRRARKRIGRGLGSGKGRYSGRGLKGQKARSGSHKMPAGFEGGQMPIDMRLPKLRGSTSADAMPIGPFRTYNQPVNLADIDDRFRSGDEVTPDTLVEKGLLKSTRVDVKILARGELTKKLTIAAHGFSQAARAKIEAKGGTVVWLRGEPTERPAKPKRRRHPVAGSSDVAPEPAGVEPNDPDGGEGEEPVE
jgi:large subunit ribosomal protein L15